jgi:hypothetical protein
MVLCSLHITFLRPFKFQQKRLFQKCFLLFTIYNTISNDNDADFSIFSQRKDKGYCRLYQNLNITRI